MPMHPKKNSANSLETCENCTMRASISVQRTSDQNRPISTSGLLARWSNRQADVFTDLVELQSKLGRDPSERPAPREPRHHAP